MRALHPTLRRIFQAHGIVPAQPQKEATPAEIARLAVVLKGRMTGRVSEYDDGRLLWSDEWRCSPTTFTLYLEDPLSGACFEVSLTPGSKSDDR